eukprot:s366_g23.t1
MLCQQTRLERGTYGTQLAPVTRLGPVDAASLCVAGVALGYIDLHFVWQAWHLVTWTFTLCGRRGTYGTQLAPVTRLGPVDAASLCVAGVALGDIDLHFVAGVALGDIDFTLCGRRGTYGTQLAPVTRLGPVDAASLCVAGVALGDIDLHFVWQAWRGTWRHRPSLCVAGVALGDIDLHFVWQAWHLVTWTFTLCGTRGTYGTQLAPVTRLGPLTPRHFVWQAWHLETSTFTLCGRRGTWTHRFHFVWQAWHLWHSLAPVTRLGPVDAASLCVAGVALGNIDLHFVWQAWHLVTWTFTLCGRRGTHCTQLAPVTRLGPVDAASLCVAGVALGDIDLHFVWQACHSETSTFTLCGRHGTYGTQLSCDTLWSR